MNKIQLVNRIRDLFRLRTAFKNPVLKKEYFAEISLLNFNRLRYFGYFLMLMGSILLYFDLFIGDSVGTYEVSQFMILDISMVVSSTIIILVTHIKAPKTIADIKPRHQVFFNLYLLYHLIWTVGISIIESKTANGVPTYLIGVFSLATIYLFRGLPFLLILIGSLAGLFTGLLQYGLSYNELVNQYSSTIVLIIIAWIVSRVLMNTRIRSFIARKEIELARDNLDQTVKERTAELQTSNEKLLAEIRERERYEKGLKQEKKKAEEADRLKSVFLANMSHEIRTPLNGILGFGDLLRIPELSDDKKEKYLEIISNNGQQLLKIIDDVMDISMIESNQLKLNIIEFKLEHLFPDAKVFYDNFSRIHNKDHLEIINEGISGEPDTIIEGDPARVQQILYNLLSNAIKFTHTGTIRYGSIIEEGYALIYVEDTGIGIDMEISKTIFERFRQGEESKKRSYGGNGLGLSISKGLTEMLGGMLWVDLHYRKGARLCFSIPTKNVKNKLSLKQLEESSNILEKKGIIIKTPNADKLMSLDYFSKRKKSRILKEKLSSFSDISPIDFPEIIILSTHSKDLQETREVEKLLQRIENRIIIAIIDQSTKSRIKLQALGCSLVLEHPVNINLLLAYIHASVMEKAQV